MIAANKLYPHAVMVIPGIIGKDVRKFLNLYRDSFNFLSVKDIDIEQVDKIIVVDTNSKSRLEKPLGKLFEKPGVDIVVYGCLKNINILSPVAAVNHKRNMNSSFPHSLYGSLIPCFKFRFRNLGSYFITNIDNEIFLMFFSILQAHRVLSNSQRAWKASAIHRLRHEAL